MKRSEATGFLENIDKPAVIWLELCYGDKRLTEACSYAMGYTDADLEKAKVTHAAKSAVEAIKIAEAADDDQGTDSKQEQDDA
ncbi:MAG TPA: hypothetical protein GXZ82_03990 [Firmicutes bacterium]|nr:hypothetical protein [Bacillota bacterium]